MVDDSHAVGFIGEQRPRHARALRRDGPRRHPHRHARQGAGRRVRRLHGGRARRSSNCCGSARGRTSSPTRSRPRIAGASLEVLELLRATKALRCADAAGERRALPPRDDGAGLHLVPGQHPIIPVMLGDAALATQMADALLDEGIYVIGFSYPGGAARARRASARRWGGAHRRADRPGGRGVREGRAARSGVDSRETTRRMPHDEGTGEVERAPGLTLTRVKKPEVGPQRRADPGPEDRDLRHRHPHLQLGRVGAEDDPGADARRPRVHGRDRRDGPGGARLQPSATASRARATSPAASAATAAPAAATSAATRWASASIARARSPSTS